MISLKTNFEFNEAVFINFINLNKKEKEMVRKWRNNKNIRKWMYTDHLIFPGEHNKFIEKLKNDIKNFYWIAKDKEGLYLGTILLNRVDLRNRNAYLGIYSNPEAIVSGTGYVLMEHLKKIAFDIANFHTLKLEVVENNKCAIKFYKRCGFTEEGCLKEFVRKDNRWYDVIVMGIQGMK